MDAATPTRIPYPVPSRSADNETPISRQSGALAPRASLVGRMRDAARRNDVPAEQEAAIALARMCFGRSIHVADAASLLLRALALTQDTDDRPLRMETAAHLAALGRHDEAAELLRSKEMSHDAERLDLGLAAGDAAARNGDAAGAAVIYRELAVADLRDPRPLQRFGSLASWSVAPVSPERASDAWLGAAARSSDGPAALLDIARAFESSPNHSRAADAFALDLTRQDRHEAADEVLRAYGRASGTPLETARRRIKQAQAGGAMAAAFGAAMDAASFEPASDEATQALSSMLDTAHLEPPSAQDALRTRAVTEELVAAVTKIPVENRLNALLRLSEKLRGCRAGWSSASRVKPATRPGIRCAPWPWRGKPASTHRWRLDPARPSWN